MKLTKWFSADAKPVIQGVYQTPNPHGKRYQFWNGKFWGYYSYSIDKAYKDRESKSSEQPKKWRGLVEKP